MSDSNFNLHIEYRVDYYDSAPFPVCKVTYPSPDGDDIAVNYVTDQDERCDIVLQRAIKDIGAFIKDPIAWRSNYINLRSTDVGMKIEEAKRMIEIYQQSAHDHKIKAETYHKWSDEKKREIKALEEMRKRVEENH